MAFLEWSDRYVLNLKDVDEQHQKLFKLVNGLHDSVVNGEERSAVKKVLDELVDYTVYHFATEERLFLEHDYPRYEEHKQEHNALILRVLDLQERYEEGIITISYEVLDFLSEWLKKHTMGSDQGFALYARSGIKIS